jgi:hypothetical protein
MRLLCIVSNVLGNRTYSEALRERVETAAGVMPRFVEVNPLDLRPKRWLDRQSDVLRAATTARLIADEHAGSFDALLLNGWEFLLGTRHLTRRVPTAVALDITPALIPRVGTRPGTLMRRIARSLFTHLLHARFRSAAADVAAFMPMSQWSAESLVSSYGVPRDKVHVAHLPLALDVWRPGVPVGGDRLRLLFVGNNFDAKGGPELL